MGNLPLYSWGNGSFIMIFVFGLVIIGLIAAVFFMMNSDKKRNKITKKEDNRF